MNKHLKTNNLKDPSAYFRPVATDGVVFKIIDNELHVLLINVNFLRLNNKRS